MKKIYLFTALAAFTQGLQAQLTLTKAANEPVVGDIWIRKGFDSVGAVPKSTGTGMTWNFSSLTMNTNTSSSTFTNVAGTTGATVFTGANLAEVKDGTSTDYHNTAGANWEYVGFYDTNGPNFLNLTNTGILAAWPLSLGSNSTDTFSGTITSGTTVSNVNGNVSYSVSGSGTVIVPGGASFTNCLQYMQTVSLTIVTGTTTQTVVEKQYQYYSSGKKFPIVEFTYHSNTTGTVVSKSFEFRADQTVLTGVRENVAEKSISVYPNPASDVISFSHAGEKIEILDMNGRVVLEKQNVKSMDVSTLSAGLYLLRMQNGDSVMLKKIAIEK